ncbi:acyl carrier protein [Treponema rectale]|jgi:acyl carrier protein|uniref:Acyl carrier protein n=1 Tax=Treponema rectale TaxID=744512 RepID=A0A7M1XI05_9SPIR|nr:acyl carrier protein [Treponema rectale]
MYDVIKQLLIDTANVDEEKIKPSARLKEDLGFDSLYAVEMALELETHFSIKIEPEELKQLITVQNVVDLVEKKEGK